MKMKYTTIEIPTIIMMFCVGMTGFFGFGSFIAGITGSDTYGYIAGCFGFILITLVARHMEKTVIKQKK